VEQKILSSFDASVRHEISSWRILLIAVSLVFAGLLGWQAWSSSELHRNYQTALMDSVTTSILSDYQDYLRKLRLKIDLFQESNYDVLNDLETLADQATPEQYMPLLDTLRANIDRSRLFALVDNTGQGILSHITGDFLPACNEEIRLTVEAGEQNQLFLHRSSKSVHFDLLQPRVKNHPEKGFLFVAFNTDVLLNLLNKYQLPMQQLYLLRTDQKGLIEITTDQNRTSFPKDDNISHELDSFSFVKEIPETRWSIAVRLDPEAEFQILNQSMRQSFLIWVILSLCLLLLYRVKRYQIKSHRKAQYELSATRERAAKILESITDAVVAIDQDNNVTFMNQQALRIFGYKSDIAIGQPFSDIVEIKSQVEDIDLKTPLHLIANKSKLQFAGATIVNKVNDEIPVNIQIVPLKHSDGTTFGAAINFEDISLTMNLSQQIVFQQQHDRLTGLFNRAAFEKHLLSLVKDRQHRQDNKEFNAVIKVDVDQFDLLNTSMGNFIGDDCLRQIGVTLVELLDDDFMVCRLGADEFVLATPPLLIKDLELLAERIRLTIANLVILKDTHKITMTACVGIVALDGGQQDAVQILSAVSQSIQVAKEKGRNRCQLYSADDPILIAHARDINMINYLKVAIEHDRFVLFRQKIEANIDTKASHKFEVLIRLIDKNGEVVAPFYFIPAAEKYSVMSEIDRWVVRHTCIALSKQTDQSIEYSVNLSGQTLGDKSFSHFVESMFEQYNVNPKRICFEITETSAISHINTAIDFMNHMRGLGVCFSLDDFGSGLSSFGYLKQLPIKYLKIDGSFIKDIAEDKIDFAFVEAIQKISSEMGKSTVGEFVESEEIQELLKTIGVDYAQGYHIHKPELWYQAHPWLPESKATKD
jgi:diguanylate cyclase (GGDEF)-like protein/PAS domain S-box-containing protein